VLFSAVSVGTIFYGGFKCVNALLFKAQRR